MGITLPASCMGKLVTCTIYDGETVVTTVTDSVESFCVRDGGRNEVYVALLKYSKSAAALDAAINGGQQH